MLLKVAPGWRVGHDEDPGAAAARRRALVVVRAGTPLLVVLLVVALLLVDARLRLASGGTLCLLSADAPAFVVVAHRV
jgi:hypothetical protein